LKRRIADIFFSFSILMSILINEEPEVSTMSTTQECHNSSVQCCGHHHHHHQKQNVIVDVQESAVTETTAVPELLDLETGSNADSVSTCETTVVATAIVEAAVANSVIAEEAAVEKTAKAVVVSKANDRQHAGSTLSAIIISSVAIGFLLLVIVGSVISGIIAKRKELLNQD
jgi:hypothetical protein